MEQLTTFLIEPPDTVLVIGLAAGTAVVVTKKPEKNVQEDFQKGMKF